MDVLFFAVSGGACVGCGSNGEQRFVSPEKVAREMIAAAARQEDRQSSPPRVKRRKAA